MNERNQAIDILKRARDLLAERLTEQVLASRDEILEDAMGMSYESEINAIYDQMGARLNHLSAMIGSLPPEPEATEDKTNQTKANNEEPGPKALPAPKPIAGYLAPREPISFRTFAYQVNSGDVKGAGTSLSILFGLEPQRGQRCAETFFQKLKKDPNVMLKAQQLRQELTNGNFNASLVLLWECFGLQGVESIGVIQALRLHLEASAASESPENR